MQLSDFYQTLQGSLLWLPDYKRKWVILLNMQVKLAYPGTAEYFLKASHIIRSKCSHGITASKMTIKEATKSLHQGLWWPHVTRLGRMACRLITVESRECLFWFIPPKLQLLMLAQVNQSIKVVQEKGYKISGEKPQIQSLWYLSIIGCC